MFATLLRRLAPPGLDHTLTHSHLQGDCPTGNGGGTVSWHDGPAPTLGTCTPCSRMGWSHQQAHRPHQYEQLGTRGRIQVTPATDLDTHAGGRSRACLLVPRQPLRPRTPDRSLQRPQQLSMPQLLGHTSTRLSSGHRTKTSHTASHDTLSSPHFGSWES